ncbi:MAG: 3-phosphoshikimate 1-carboxyvinyltransferase [Lachnospiraceae bacterium]|nr:3-phosphoshikimate 1-carboxyvinyltransferase [Lachnospiraceae bacterium]
MIVDIKPSKLKGVVKAPPSKSFLHRLLICAALADGESKIGNLAESQDILATRDCLNALKNGLSAGKAQNEPVIFNCRESGSTLRFFVPIALLKCQNTIFKGAPRLIERGIGIYEEVLGNKGVEISKESDGIHVKGELLPGLYEIPGNISSQYITGLMFALPLLDKESTITVLPPVESRAYIDLTLAVLRQSGIEIIENPKNTFKIKGNQKYKPLNCDAEGDWSNAAFFFALKALGHDIEVTGLNPESGQGDRVCIKDFELLGKEEVSIAESIDLGPVLMAFAAAKDGGILTDTKRLRIKESDRALVMAEELKKFKALITVNENDVIIEKSELQPPLEILEGHNDHRIVMSLAVLLTLKGGTINGAEAVSKSFPDFFEKLSSLGCELEIRE